MGVNLKGVSLNREGAEKCLCTFRKLMCMGDKDLKEFSGKR